jgi:hypothetical protein
LVAVVVGCDAVAVLLELLPLGIADPMPAVPAAAIAGARYEVNGSAANEAASAKSEAALPPSSSAFATATPASSASADFAICSIACPKLCDPVTAAETDAAIPWAIKLPMIWIA